MKFAARAVSATVASTLLAALLVQSSPALGAETISSVPVSSQHVAAGTVPVAQPAVLTAETTRQPDAPLAEIQPDDTIAYPSLAAAVAAQADEEAENEELRCLAGAIYFESRGEPLAGQLAVAEVILNRASSGRFAQSVCGVVTQRGQFSFVRGGRIPAVAANRDYRTAMAVAKVAMNEAWESDAANALYFNGRRAAPGGARVRVAAIGNHVFYR